jgi:hypothetical protein
MRKYITLFFSVTLFLAACGGKTPSDVIGHDRMIALLTDMHIIDGATYTMNQLPDTLYKYETANYLALFKKYQTDSVQFKRSLRYYTTKPVELQAMYDKVLDNLKQKQDSLNKTFQKNALPRK